MDGVLVIDKPAGPTSHDVVARMRRALGQQRIGHTGTLDPLATGVLPLVLGRATRLARYFVAGSKRYRATLALGVATDTCDAQGQPVGEPYHGEWPHPEAIARALDAFRGTFLQQPPVYSAKKIGGARSYELARRRSRVPPREQPDRAAPREQPAAVPVTVHRLDVVEAAGSRIELDIHCSAGFYVRALADDLGRRLGTGAHLTALCRTRSGEFTLADAVALGAAEADPAAAAQQVIPLGRALSGLAAVVLTPEGVRRAAHGRDLRPGDLVPGGAGPARDGAIRLLDDRGELIGIAEPASATGFLHPAVVLM